MARNELDPSNDNGYSLWDAVQDLTLLAHVYGWGTPLSTGGPEGDIVQSVWYDEGVDTIYIG